MNLRQHIFGINDCIILRGICWMNSLCFKTNYKKRAFFNPAIPTKIFFQSRNPDGLYWPIPIPIIQFCLSPFPKLGRAFSVGDDFLTSIDPLKSMVNVRCKFISFHQNNDIVYFRSFQSFARIT